MIKVSVICPCLNEEQIIRKCAESILHQDYPQEQLEILFVDGGSTDATKEQLALLAETNPQIILLDNPHKTVPYAMNIGIRAARGEFIIRIDAHCIYPANYISTLIDALEDLPGAQNVGGCCHTIPANDSLMARAIAIACSHPLGVGGSTFRIGADKIQEVDTVPFGCWRRQWFDKVGLFDEELTRNQDDEFNARTIERGGKIYILPSLSVDYPARPTLSKAFHMFYQYGLFKPLVNKKLRHPATARQFAPMLFVFGLVIGAIVSAIWHPFVWAYLAGIVCYLLAVCAVALRKKNAMLPIVFFSIHCAYGSGYIRGMLKVLFGRSFSVEANH